MVLDLVAVVTDQIGRLLDVTQCLEPVLPHLHGHQSRQLEAPLADDVCGVTQQPDPLLPGRGRPGGGERASGVDCVSNVLLGGLGETAKDDVAIDR